MIVIRRFKVKVTESDEQRLEIILDDPARIFTCASELDRDRNQGKPGLQISSPKML